VTEVSIYNACDVNGCDLVVQYTTSTTAHVRPASVLPLPGTPPRASYAGSTSKSTLWPSMV
jgi:hypothetical protein